jgi:hypothetical protein
VLLKSRAAVAGRFDPAIRSARLDLALAGASEIDAAPAEDAQAVAGTSSL